MALGEKVLLKKAEKLQLKELQKSKYSTACLSELEELLHYIGVIHQPKPSDYYNRRELVRAFNAMANEIYGNCNFPVVEEFGSFVMDIFSAESDLDLSVNFSHKAVEFPREKKIQILQKFAKKLYTHQRGGYVSNVQRIISAKVPIVKFVDCGTGIECDISVENRDGIAKSRIVHIVSAIDERFPKLSFVMKAWAKAHDINSSKDRTLNSISIISLVAFHLQTRDPPILPPLSAIFKDGVDPANVMKIVRGYLGYGKRNKETVAELFVTLLVKLASVETLWANGLCASTYEGAWIQKTWDSKVGCISVEDFTIRSENLARAVGKVEVNRIYNCIHRSLGYIMAFKDSQLQGAKLRELLFCLDSTPTLKNEGFAFLDMNNAANPPFIASESMPNKRMRLAEGWSPHGPAQQHYGGTLSNVTSMVPLPWCNYQNFVPLPNPYGFNVPPSLNPMVGVPLPYVGVGQLNLQHAQPHHNQNQEEHRPFYMYRTG